MINPYILPVTAKPNQTIEAHVVIDGENRVYKLMLRYLEVCGYWVMDIANRTGKPLVSSIPLLRDVDLLQPFRHLGLGSMLVLDMNHTGTDGPDANNLGTDYLLVWGSEG